MVYKVARIAAPLPALMCVSPVSFDFWPPSSFKSFWPDTWKAFMVILLVVDWLSVLSNLYFLSRMHLVLLLSKFEIPSSSLFLSSLRAQINKKSLECLNQDDNYPVTNALETTDPHLYLQSSSIDPQLLVQFEFIQVGRDGRQQRPVLLNAVPIEDFSSAITLLLLLRAQFIIYDASLQRRPTLLVVNECLSQCLCTLDGVSYLLAVLFLITFFITFATWRRWFNISCVIFPFLFLSANAHW